MSDSPWDLPGMKPDTDFVKFTNVGDSLAGVITSISVHTWPDGDMCPKLRVRKDNGDEVTYTASQAVVKTKLAELRPSVGDRISIVHTEVEKRNGGKTLKHFDVEVGAAAPKPSPSSIV